MAQIRPKQLKIGAQGDLIIGNASGNGQALSLGTLNKVLVSNGTTAEWDTLDAASLNLTRGDVFIGNTSNVAQETSATAEGQIIISGAGPDFNFGVGTMSAGFVTFAADSANNISSTDVQSAITEVAAERSYVHSAITDPLPGNDSVDTAGDGLRFKIGDIWINTVTDNVFHAVDVSAGTAVWVRGEGVAGAFVYKGDLDASDAGDALPSNPHPGDWYRISASSGTKNFNGTWDVSGEPNGATFNIGDSIVYGDDGQWHKVDNTDPIIAAGNGIDVVVGTNTIVSVNADESTITATGGAGTEIAVYGGDLNQTLLGAGTTSDANWGYLGSLYDTDGVLILEGTGVSGATNYFTMVNTGVGAPLQLGAEGSSADIDVAIDPKGAGNIVLDGIQWPNGGISAGSILVANTANSLEPITAPDGVGDQILVYNDATNTLEWVTRSGVGGNAYGVITTDAGTITANDTSDTMQLLGGIGISTAGNAGTETITVNFTRTGMADTPVTGADTVPFFDASNTNEAEYRSWASVITDLNIVTSTSSGFWSTIQDNQAVPNVATADFGNDTLTFAGQQGVNVIVSDTPETVSIALDIDGLSATTPDLTNDYIVIYDTSLGEHRKVLANSVGGAAFATVQADSGTATADDSSDTITFAGGNGIATAAANDPEVVTFNADADGTTITSTGGTSNNQLSVYGGLSNQTLISNGAADATWQYMNSLYDASGNLILQGSSTVSAENYVRITNAPVGNDVNIESAGSDANINMNITAKGTGTLTLDGTEWPDGGVAQFSVLATNTANVLEAITASDGVGDLILMFDDSTNSIIWETRDNITGNSFTTWNTDSGTIVADNISDSATVSGGEGLTTTATPATDTIEVAMDINGLVEETAISSTTDFIAVYDASATGHRKATVDSLLASAGAGTPFNDEQVATGGVNETLVGMFSFTPVADDSITVYFNGVKLRRTGWSRSGLDLTLNDAINGYSTESGDIISVCFEY